MSKDLRSSMLKTALFSFVIAGLFLSAGCGSQEPQHRPYAEVVHEVLSSAAIDAPAQPCTTLESSVDPTGGNDDFNHFAGPAPDGWKLVADLEGPGVVTRFWMTGIQPDQEIRFLFGRERRPRIVLTRRKALEGEFPFTAPLANWEQSCLYSYVPIPYRQRLRIMVRDRGYSGRGFPRLFYQINHQSLDEAPDYPKELSAEDESALREVLERWKKGPAVSKEQEQVAAEVAPDRPLVLHLDAGPTKIDELVVEPDLSGFESATAAEAALSSLELRMTWDGASSPSVHVPLAAFFGSGWRRVRYESHWLGMEADRFICRFPMTYRSSAEIEVINRSGPVVPVQLACRRTVPDDGETARAYFHAVYRRSTPEDLGTPHTVLDAKGRGRYAGTMLYVDSRKDSWWILEGDETITLDGAARPQWRGTGLEDYFNGGWYYKYAAARPMHGLLMREPFRTVQYRFHGPDPVTFDESIRVQFERGPGHDSPGTMESVAYYYLDAPAPVPPPSGPDARPVPPGRYAEQTLMTSLINHEWLGDFEGAHDYLRAFMERHPDFEAMEMLELRELAYRIRRDGLAAHADELKAVIASGEGAVREQARQLKWFHADERRALLGVYANALTKVFLDGEQAARIDHPAVFHAWPVELDAGGHALAVESERTRRMPWVQLCLRTHAGNVTTQAGWKYADDVESGWTERGYDDSGWDVYAHRGVKGPPELPFITIAPNPWVGMQAGAVGIRVPAWKPDGKKVYLRHRFEISP
ncbi:glycoside hydrolase family 172 protein [Kiritimatiella glycovorans]|uniref:DUF2961 domain-containing protein n=1 Tax=Kiritimatiella glycovorans TaxID=1307763 RepID=A0A0G3EFC0_9BACT|nr:glycoside hydrolase family 172 protein [Kiritimatiella glycovorans]AKJ65033.1 hypothetical protein L21SP4_01796 [Kiritimatiella glycovorans]